MMVTLLLLVLLLLLLLLVYIYEINHRFFQKESNVIRFIEIE